MNVVEERKGYKRLNFADLNFIDEKEVDKEFVDDIFLFIGQKIFCLVIRKSL